MKTVTFELGTPREAMANFSRQLTLGVAASPTRIVFASHDLLTQVLTETRWSILKLLCGAAAMPISSVAEGLGRSMLEVEFDVNALLHAGIIDRKPDDKIIFPYDEISLDIPIVARTTV